MLTCACSKVLSQKLRPLGDGSAVSSARTQIPYRIRFPMHHARPPTLPRRCRQAKAFQEAYFSADGGARPETEGMQRLRRLCSGLAAPGGVDALLTALQVQHRPPRVVALPMCHRSERTHFTSGTHAAILTHRRQACPVILYVLHTAH